MLSSTLLKFTFIYFEDRHAWGYISHNLPGMKMIKKVRNQLLLLLEWE